MSFQINWLAFVVSVVVYEGLGALWYSPILLGNQWMAEIGKTADEIQAEGGQGRAFGIAVIGGVIIAFMLANVVDWLGASSLLAGALAGLWIWLGFVATTSATNSVYAGRTLRLWLIDTGYNLVGFVLMGAILGVWQ